MRYLLYVVEGVPVTAKCSGTSLWSCFGGRT